MRVGTKSVLFGVHAVWIHPFFVAWAWWKLFGFPWDLQLWVAFFLSMTLATFSVPIWTDSRASACASWRPHHGLALRSGMARLYPLPFTALGKARRQKVLKALPGGQARVRLDARLALSPHGAVEWRASRVHACGEWTPVVRQYH